MLPSIVAEIGGAGLIGWSVSLYEIGSIVAGAASALLTMRYGLQRSMSLAAGLYGAGCLLSAISPVMPLVLMGRALQGLGGGGLVAMSCVAVGMIFPRRYTARALAVIATFWGVSAFSGPLIGGLFVEYASWRWGFIFFAAQALGLAGWLVLRQDTASALQPTPIIAFPWKRVGLLCVAVVLIAAGGVKITLAQTLEFILGGSACLIGFLWFDGRAGNARLLPRRAFDLRQRTGAALVMILCFSIATIAITAFGPLLLTTIHSTSALTAGYIVACASIGWTIAAVLGLYAMTNLVRDRASCNAQPPQRVRSSN